VFLNFSRTIKTFFYKNTVNVFHFVIVSQGVEIWQML
jgi:hypothetical protein